MPKPNVEDIKTAMRSEAERHRFLPEVKTTAEPSQIVPLDPAVMLPYAHEVTCACGHVFTVRTQLSGRTPGGAQEFWTGAMMQLATHVIDNQARAILALCSEPN